MEHIIDSHLKNNKAIEHVYNILRKYNFVVNTVFYHELYNMSLNNCLIISVGGDGTILDINSFLHSNNYLLGINSDPKRSMGIFCAANYNNFEIVLNNILIGNIVSNPIMRICAFLNNKELPFYALNDVLISSNSPAGVSKYILKFNNMSERQISSGVWISTAAGSSGALFSAGGEMQSFIDNRLQFRVREPYSVNQKKYNIISGFINKLNYLEVISVMSNGKIFFDGPNRTLRFPIGSCLRLQLSSDVINIFITDNMKERRNKNISK